MLSTLFAAVVFFITQPIANKLGKKEWCVFGAAAGATVFAVLFFFPLKSAMAFICVAGVCYMLVSGMQVLVWALLNDSIDYHELRTGERSEGVMYSSYSFFRKLASAVSGSLSSFVLGLIGYNTAAGAVQTDAVIQGIWHAYTSCYALGYGLAALVLFLMYPLTKRKTEEMLEELKRRRAERGVATETVSERAE